MNKTMIALLWLAVLYLLVGILISVQAAVISFVMMTVIYFFSRDKGGSNESNEKKEAAAPAEKESNS